MNTRNPLLIVAQPFDCHQLGNNNKEDYNLGVSMPTINQNSLWILMVFTSSSDDRNHLQTSLVILVLETDLGSWSASWDKICTNKDISTSCFIRIIIM